VKITVERLSHIDVNELHRLGAFTEVTLWFPFMRIRTNRWVVEYFHARSPADRPPQRIPIQWTNCTFGGARPWLMCLCGRRVGKLYYGNGFLGCRPCGELIYESQRASRKRRLYLKARRIRCRLGDDGRPGIDAFPQRPFGMQRKIYARLRMQAEMIEHQLRQGRVYVPRERKKYDATRSVCC
jgi:hypothetical protein